MPIYEYVCKRCAHAFDELVYDAKDPPCPKCAAEGATRVLSAFAVGSASGGSPAPGPGCGSCPAPGGPGGCGFRS